MDLFPGPHSEKRNKKRKNAVPSTNKAEEDANNVTLALNEAPIPANESDLINPKQNSSALAVECLLRYRRSIFDKDIMLYLELEYPLLKWVQIDDCDSSSRNDLEQIVVSSSNVSAREKRELVPDLEMETLLEQGNSLYHFTKVKEDNFSETSDQSSSLMISPIATDLNDTNESSSEDCLVRYKRFSVEDNPPFPLGNLYRVVKYPDPCDPDLIKNIINGSKTLVVAPYSSRHGISGCE
jgi:hypothetical protein